jgi:hypothetical protein
LKRKHIKMVSAKLITTKSRLFAEKINFDVKLMTLIIINVITIFYVFILKLMNLTYKQIKLMILSQKKKKKSGQCLRVTKNTIVG